MQIKELMEIRKGLVSVVTPAFNAEWCISRLLDSVLTQDYPEVEMIVVDDGSTDGTASLVEGYAARFAERGYELKVIRKERSGQSGAIDAALKVVRGEFLVWPDSDDYYTWPYSLRRLAETLSVAPADVGAVRCLPGYVDASLRPIEEGVPQVGNVEKERLFSDSFFNANGFWHLSGGYMVRMEAFLAATGVRGIPHAREAGQNWQLLLPVLYRFRCLTVKERLHTVVVHPDSHSRGAYRSYSRLMDKHRDFEEVLVAALKGIRDMPEEERRGWIAGVRKKYMRIRLKTAWKYKRPLDFIWIALRLMVYKIKYRRMADGFSI